jgi:iron complex transport system substrate-binding protein
MAGKVFVAMIAVAVFVGAAWLKSRLPEPATDAAAAETSAQRIISLSPSVTETLFALGLGDQVVGVTRFCNYPPEVNEKTRIGGFLDPNIEAIVALRPDLIVTLASDDPPESAFERLNFKTLVVDHRGVEGILDSITVLGRACGAEAKAEAMVAELRGRIDRVAKKTAGRRRPRVLFSVSRGLGTGRLEDIYVAGGNRCFQSLVEVAGGENVFAHETAAFPVVSTEGILYANPEVIIDLVPMVSHRREGLSTILDEWRQIPDVDAVKNGRVYALEDDFATVPGPRFILLFEKVARMLHPDVDWEGK